MKRRWQLCRRALALAGSVLIACVQAPLACAQADKPTEYEVKAAYLSNFGRFIEWPGATEQGSVPGEAAVNPAEPFNICVLGADPFGPSLDRALKDETINRSPLAARRIARVQDATGCRILYIAPSEDGKLKTILTALDNAGVLTVSGSPDFTRLGGMIQFVLAGNRVRFELNLAAVQRAHLNVSSELTKLATAVRRAP